MAIPRSFLHYRIERVPHPVAVRMVDPLGVQVEQMCCALTKLEQTAKSQEVGRRDVHAIARLLSSTSELVEDPVAHMLGDWKGFRETFSAGLSALNVHSEDRGGVIWVKPSVDTYPIVKTAAAAFGRLGSILADKVYT